jgi:hypothetical protein
MSVTLDELAAPVATRLGRRFNRCISDFADPALAVT